MKEKMPNGPLQFKCPYDCGYIMNDKDLVALLESRFPKIIDHYRVLFFWMIY